MVLWCRCCGALVGVRYPYSDWTVDRDSICPACAEKNRIIKLHSDKPISKPHRITQGDTADFPPPEIAIDRKQIHDRRASLNAPIESELVPVGHDCNELDEGFLWPSIDLGGGD